MDLFIGNISPEATPNELRQLLRRALFLGPRRFRVGVVRARARNGDEFVYAYAVPPSDRLAEKIIRRLNGRPYRHRNLIVREFHHRATANERRCVDWRARTWLFAERRRKERRRFFASRGPGRRDEQTNPSNVRYLDASEGSR